MRRRSLCLPSPVLLHNPDGNTGAFFRAENYRREFYVPKTGGLNGEVFALRVIFSGDLPSEAGLMMPFHDEKYGNKFFGYTGNTMNQYEFPQIDCLRIAIT